MKYVFIQRNDDKFNGSVIDLPESLVESTLKRHPNWKVLDSIRGKARSEPDAVISDAPKAPAMECPLCGKQYKTDIRLQAHKKTHL